ncbi:MAG: DHH family phosphoesterase [archaeon]|nr:DHH family phosphoesterase [archaeon]
MDESVLSQNLVGRLSKAVDIVRGHNFVQVYSHHDADGISAAGIIANTLFRCSKGFTVTIFATLDEKSMDVIKESSAECIIITDLGASYIKELEGLDKDIIVLDHHTLRDDSEKIVYVNPHIDGNDSACGATIAFLFSIKMEERNWDLVQIAFAGIVGDKQHLHGLTGCNQYILREGIKRGYISISEGSIIPAGQITNSLYASIEPYIRGVSGDPKGVKKILEDAGILCNEKLTFENDSKKRLSSLIAIKLIKQGVTIDTMTEIVRRRYVLKDWNMDAEMLADLLDACGRQSYQWIGIGICLGSKEALEKAQLLRDEYSKVIVNAAVELDKKKLIELKNIQYFDSSGFTGILASIAMRFIGNPNKPVIGLDDSEEMIKLSGRATSALIKKGVNLAVALQQSAQSVGGNGGGHDIAGGGIIPHGTKDDFLRSADKIIGQQLNAT